jgi:hypothetical protein
MKRMQLVTGGRDEFLLGALSAGEHHLRALRPQRVGYRQRRHHVTGGAAGADHDQRNFHA